MTILLKEIQKSSSAVKFLFGLLSFVFLVYLLWPGPTHIEDFPPLTNAAKSTLSGDTVEVPNIVGFFSNNYRGFVLDFYSHAYQNLTKLPFPPIKLNYPPEQAFTYIKDQTHSTLLEERVYPLRNSLFINGLEPFYEDGSAKYWGATKFGEGGVLYETKTTLRFYPSPIWARIIIWLGITTTAIFLWILGRKIIFSK